MIPYIEPVVAGFVQSTAAPKLRGRLLAHRWAVSGSALAAVALFVFGAPALRAQSLAPSAPRSNDVAVQPPNGGPTATSLAGGIWAATGGDVFSNPPHQVSVPPHNRTLLILSSEMSARKQGGLQEDLAIMSQVLNTALGDFGIGSPQARTAMGIMLTPGAAPIRNLYIEGYGVLFTIDLNFPLVPPPPQPQGEKGAPAPSSAWEQAKRALYGARGFDWFLGNVTSPQAPPSPGPWDTYSQKKVDRLKTATLKALQNATNIRGLRPDDSITVCIFGSSPSPEGVPGLPAVARDIPFLQRVPSLGVPVVGGSRVSSILTVRVKKADVDAFANGKMTEEQFRRKAQIMTYATALGTDGAGGRYGNYFRYGGGGYSGGTGGFGGGISGGGGAGGGFGGGNGAEQQ